MTERKALPSTSESTLARRDGTPQPVGAASNSLRWSRQCQPAAQKWARLSIPIRDAVWTSGQPRCVGCGTGSQPQIAPRNGWSGSAVPAAGSVRWCATGRRQPRLPPYRDRSATCEPPNISDSSKPSAVGTPVVRLAGGVRRRPFPDGASGDLPPAFCRPPADDSQVLGGIRCKVSVYPQCPTAQDTGRQAAPTFSGHPEQGRSPLRKCRRRVRRQRTDPCPASRSCRPSLHARTLEGNRRQ